MRKSLLHVAKSNHACAACPSRPLCTRAKRQPRRLILRPQEQCEALQAARERQKTQAFKDRYAARAGIEGTISQGVRRCDLRRARYIGYARVHLQHVLTAVALNVVRLANWFAKRPRIRTKPIPFVALFPACTGSHLNPRWWAGKEIGMGLHAPLGVRVSGSERDRH